MARVKKSKNCWKSFDCSDQLKVKIRIRNNKEINDTKNGSNN